MPSENETSIAVIGLGYVGLPLAVEFGRRFPTVGVDIDAERVAELKEGRDSTREVDPEELQGAGRLRYTASIEEAKDCNVYIVTVPTPIDDATRPDLQPLISASRAVGRVLGAGDIVVYESTVYPGATEEVCIPILEKESGLRLNAGRPFFEGAGDGGFFVGYSPERINPGDKEHRVTNIKKVTSGSTPAVAGFVDGLYAEVITAGTHKAPSIRVAEAAKVIENTQRDINIALINELSMLFNRLGIDTEAVLEAASTKWNFLPFRPGLVGGHCIGVDPYYLTHKAQQVGYHPEMILAGRRINDRMGQYVANEVVKLMLKKRIHVADSRVLMLGFTFKENCPDLRNTRAIDIVEELKGYGARVEIHDPWVDPDEAMEEYEIDLVRDLAPDSYDAIVLAVAHAEFRQLGWDRIREFGREAAVVYDVKHVLPAEKVDGRL
ncbi:MAG TPA: Vi polysaccharide biosynthesis UDP-N-acetylglucosamine C-6 dehydrogenase TviB [Gammaproteobacteria bacterium]|nr:Vi polysaccharide biosynthesis UDP-N-acetylglucosamine C-6 dehydrogenase TviB [Gammaproteobacteria bacterium]